MGTCIKAPE